MNSIDIQQPLEAKTILLVEDEQLVCDAIESILSKSGYNVISAKSPKEALELLQVATAQPDLILTDIVMPGMRGTELVTLLKKKLPNMKIIYMSGYTDQAVSNKRLQEENSRFIGKPFTPTELLQKLRDALAD